MKKRICILLSILCVFLLLLSAGCRRTPGGEILMKDGRLDLEGAGISIKNVESVEIREAGRTKGITDQEDIQEILNLMANLPFSEYTVPTNQEGGSTEAPGSRQMTVTLIGKEFQSKVSLPLHDINGTYYLAPGGDRVFLKFIEDKAEEIFKDKILLNDLQSENESFVTAFNESGHGVIYYLYYFAPEDHRSENYHYYLERYETDLLGEDFPESGQAFVHSGRRGEINGVDWHFLYARFSGLMSEEAAHSEDHWDKTESIGFWRTWNEQPVILKLSECGKDYQNVKDKDRDHGVLSLLQAENEILGTQKQLLGNIEPSK